MGNSKSLVFSNCTHNDNDCFDQTTHEMSLRVLKDMIRECKRNSNHLFDNAFEHIRKSFLKSGKFSTYTTCGYKTFFKPKEMPIVYLRAYFLYNSLGVSIKIPQSTSCYHTFDATSGMHQTSVPIIEGSRTIFFNDNC